MGVQEYVLIGLALVIGIWILIRVARTLFKVAIFVGILFGGYYIWNSGSADGLIGTGLESMLHDTTITQLMDKHCTPENRDGTKCECVVTPIYNDLSMKYNKYEMTQLEQNKKKMIDEMMSSLKTKRPEIEACIKNKGEQSTVFKMYKMLKSLSQMVSS